MAFYQNLEIHNQRQLSKYPFDNSSTLLLDTHVFPVNWIESMNLQIQDAVFPLYISKVAIQEKIIELTVVDGSGQLQCRILLTPDSNRIIDSYDCIAGQIKADSRLYNWLV